MTEAESQDGERWNACGDCGEPVHKCACTPSFLQSKRAELSRALAAEAALTERFDAVLEAGAFSPFSSKPIECHVADLKADRDALSAELSSLEATLPRCSWSGCVKYGTRWIARHVTNCDDHGDALSLGEVPWVEFARKRNRVVR